MYVWFTCFYFFIFLFLWQTPFPLQTRCVHIFPNAQVAHLLLPSSFLTLHQIECVPNFSSVLCIISPYLLNSFLLVVSLCSGLIRHLFHIPLPSICLHFVCPPARLSIVYFFLYPHSNTVSVLLFKTPLHLQTLHVFVLTDSHITHLLSFPSCLCFPPSHSVGWMMFPLQNSFPLEDTSVRFIAFVIHLFLHKA